MVAYAWFVLAYNLFVILWGAFVRATGAGAGCGSHWPLCNGVVVPRNPRLETLIELGHRLTSGLDVLLVGLLVYLVWRNYAPGHRARTFAVLSMVFLIAEALIGAGLVIFEQVAENTSETRGIWVGGHLVNTFLLLAVLAQCAWSMGERKTGPETNGFWTGLWLKAAMAGMLLLGISGAITALGDTLFPVASLAEGKAMTFAVDSHPFVRLRIWHPVLAIAVGAVLALAAYRAASTAPGGSTTRILAVICVCLYACQLGLGVANMWFLAPIPLQMGHLLLADLGWISLILLASPSAERAPLNQGRDRQGGDERERRNPVLFNLLLVTICGSGVTNDLFVSY